MNQYTRTSAAFEEQMLERSLRSGPFSSLERRTTRALQTSAGPALLVFWPAWFVLTLVARIVWFMIGPFARRLWKLLVRLFPVLGGIEAKGEPPLEPALPGDVATDIYGGGGTFGGPPVEIPRETIAPSWLYEDTQSSIASDPPPGP